MLLNEVFRDLDVVADENDNSAQRHPDAAVAGRRRTAIFLANKTNIQRILKLRDVKRRGRPIVDHHNFERIPRSCLPRETPQRRSQRRRPRVSGNYD